ncbi:hypothetical protein [Nocardia jinanensis]|uniref:Secreted protein n=1 Tax=Nocardia jinanensis TaxID=382504 RepID=A0A917VVS8_9NOCA|nr:hypothetical protein [Nocardia jinanensis]GGL19371.1 hypothetical protein GCM10011588_37480 [Nocardia jinanensis]
MRHIIDTVGTLAAGAVITLAVPPSAHAASGDFVYVGQNGGHAVLSDPVTDRCHNTPGAAGVVANETKLQVAAFPGPNCEGAPTAPKSGSAFESVVFSS